MMKLMPHAECKLGQQNRGQHTGGGLPSTVEIELEKGTGIGPRVLLVPKSGSKPKSNELQEEELNVFWL